MPGKSKTAVKAKRHQMFDKSTGHKLKKPTIKRLARKAGIVRVKRDMYNEVRYEFDRKLKQIIGNAIVYMEYAKRQTITSGDILEALRVSNNTMYGHADIVIRKKSKEKE